MEVTTLSQGLYKAASAGLLLVAGALAFRIAQRKVVLAQTESPAQLAVFSPQSTYSIPVVPIGSQPYVGLVDLLEPLASVEARVNGKKLKLDFKPAGNRAQGAEFNDGKNE